MELLRYNPAGVMLAEHGLDVADLEAIAPRLEEARRMVLADVAAWSAGDAVPPEKQPLDAGFVGLPERLLADLAAHGEESEVAQIRAAAGRLASAVDRVVLLGIGGSYMGARAIFEALCHPYHNELPRPCRRNCPRIYFEGNNVDNDSVAGLLGLLGGGHPTISPPDDDWGIVVISKSGGTLETAAAFRLFLRQLSTTFGGQPDEIARRVLPVTGPSGRLNDLANALGCPDIFRIPDGVGGRFSILTPVGLLPTALMGLDIEKLLAGAAAMNEHFRTAPPAENVVLQFVGVSHAMEVKKGCSTRILSIWGKQLEAAGLWYDQLLAESLGKAERGATPLTVVNTRDLHSRGQQHQEGRRDKLITNLIVDAPKRDPIAIGRSDFDQDQLNSLAEKTLPDVLTAALAGTNQAYRGANRPTADLTLPRLDEHTLGQLFQMLMLATVVEGRLIGINPYGQPGVEAYKRNMNAILRGN